MSFFKHSCIPSVVLVIAVASLHCWTNVPVSAFVPARSVSTLSFRHTKVDSSSFTFNALPNDKSSTAPSGSKSPVSGKTTSIVLDYFYAIRPFTLIQAVGATVVGRLALKRTLEPVCFAAAATSVYLSYGAGMVANDCVDVEMDALSENKSNRAIASGRISIRNAWLYTFSLGLVSLFLAGYGGGLLFTLWTLSNLVLMIGYAYGLQRLFLVKNLLCGWFAISPLVGAALLGLTSFPGNDETRKLFKLAAVGFPVHVAREILKDAEDVNVDRNKKMTLPLVLGTRAARGIAHGLVFVVLCFMVFTPSYWNMFASSPPLYAMGVIAGLPMCIRASLLPLSDGQRLLKKSIYVLLAGMIGGLLLQ